MVGVVSLSRSPQTATVPPQPPHPRITIVLRFAAAEIMTQRKLLIAFGILLLAAVAVMV